MTIQFNEISGIKDGECAVVMTILVDADANEITSEQIDDALDAVKSAFVSHGIAARAACSSLSFDPVHGDGNVVEVSVYNNAET